MLDTRELFLHCFYRFRKRQPLQRKTVNQFIAFEARLASHLEQVRDVIVRDLMQL